MTKVIIFFFIYISHAWSNMVGINKFLQDNPKFGNDEVLYISSRCSALMYHLYSLQQTPKENKKKLIESSKEFSKLTLNIRKNIYQDLDDEIHIKIVYQKIDKLIDDYIDLSNKFFYETGTYINKDMWDDLEICSDILKSRN